MVRGESYDKTIGNLKVEIKTHKIRAAYRL